MTGQREAILSALIKKDEMNLRTLPYHLSVAKYSSVPFPLSGFYTLSVAEGEISLVGESERLPQGYTHREDGWRALYIDAQLDFSLVGVLAGISSALAENGIPLFAISTYDTDYLLVKEGDFGAACTALKIKGYIII